MNRKYYKLQLLKELYEPYSNGRKTLGNQPGANIVFGEGDPDAEVMIIGEALGREEDEQRRPFVGRSGRLLTKALEGLGTKRESVFITNVVKWRPTNNRTPNHQERALGFDLLCSQIKIINPKTVIALGSVAAKTLLGDDVKISKIRGRQHQANGTTIIPTFHPAYILRNATELKSFIHDIASALQQP